MAFLTDSEAVLARWAEEHDRRSKPILKALEDLVVDNDELEQLESQIDRFNIFEAIGMVGQEIRHSCFLAFLLDPYQNHGYGDAFLKRLLHSALKSASREQVPISLVDLDVWSLADSVVAREQHNIDVLILNSTHELAIVLENKVYSGEHSDQLSRYYDGIQRRHPGWKVIACYLTPDGSLPSDERYVPIGYSDIVAAMEWVTDKRGAAAITDAGVLLRHYSQMLRRHIVTDPEIDRLCASIYQKHRRAIDLIIERIPNRQLQIHDELVKIISQTTGMRLRYNTKANLGFHPTEWDTPILQDGKGADAKALLLEFYVRNTPDYIRLDLYVNTGSEEHRQKLLDLTRSNPSLFKRLPNSNIIYTETWLQRSDLEQLELMDINTTLWQRWGEFTSHKLPQIIDAIAGEPWIWQAKETTHELP